MPHTIQMTSGHTLLPGTILHKNYIIDTVLGQGGFGITYSGTCISTKTQVAIKEFFPSGTATRLNKDGNILVSHFDGQPAASFQKGMHRFLNEANLLKEFHNLGSIVSVYDVFEENGTAYIVMEYIEGITLKQLISDEGVLSFDEMITLFKPVLLDLHEVHKKGLIHRDISPDNLIVGMDNHLHLIDFGAASFKNPNESKTMTVILKSGYAPPEQYISDGRIGAWTDVYALCATMYMVLNGEKPIDSIRRMQNDTLDFTGEHSDLKDYQKKAILRGLRLNYAERFSSAKLLYQALTTEPSTEVTATAESSALSAKVKEQIQEYGKPNFTPLPGKHTATKTVMLFAILTIVICLGAWGIFTLINRNPSQFSSINNMSNNTGTENISTEATVPTSPVTLTCDVDSLELTIGEEITYDNQFQLNYTITGDYPDTVIAITKTEPEYLLLTGSGSDALNGSYFATVYPYREYGEGTLTTSLIDSETEEVYATHSIPIKVNPPANGVYPDYEKEILTMINFVGMTIEDAKTELANMDETIEVTITEEYSSDVAAGLVMSQSIAEDTQFTYGKIKQIQLVVSKGPMPTTQAPKSVSTGNSDGNNNSGKSNTQKDDDGYTTIHLE